MIETERLVLRPWRADDAPVLYRLASDSRVSEPAQWPRHTSVGMSREVIEKYFIPNPLTFAIVDKDSGQPVGCIGLLPSGDEYFPPLEGEREVGYWVGRPHWRKGIAPEALSALIAYCRDSLHLPYLLLTALATNHPSRRVAAKCGFSPAGEFSYDGKACLAFRLHLLNANSPGR
mgnify:FL=1